MDSLPPSLPPYLLEELLVVIWYRPDASMCMKMVGRTLFVVALWLPNPLLKELLPWSMALRASRGKVEWSSKFSSHTTMAAQSCGTAVLLRGVSKSPPSVLEPPCCFTRVAEVEAGSPPLSAVAVMEEEEEEATSACTEDSLTPLPCGSRRRRGWSEELDWNKVLG